MSGVAVSQTTVVVPAWDEYASGWLTTAIDSLLAQQPPGPIVIVDNDSTVQLPDYQGVDNVNVVRSDERLTLGAARNLGVAAVHTPFVVVWDADDTMLPGTLASLTAELERDPEIVAFGMAIIEEPGGHRHRWPRRWIARLIAHPGWFALLNCVWSLYPTTGATIMRTEAVRDAAGYTDTDSSDDWALGVSLAFRGRLGWSEQPGRVYNQHDRSIWAEHLTARHQIAHTANIRARLRGDAAVPVWLRTSLPLLAVLQWAAIAAHVVRAALRRR